MKVKVTDVYKIDRLDDTEMADGMTFNDTNFSRAVELLSENNVREARRYAKIEFIRTQVKCKK